MNPIGIDCQGLFAHISPSRAESCHESEMERETKIGLATFVGGIGLEVSGLTLPYVGYALMVFGGALFLHAHWGARVSKPKIESSSVPDLSIRELFFHIDPDVLDEDDSKPQPNWIKTDDDVLNKLSTGQLRAWGEINNGGRRPQTLIPQEFWGTAEFMDNFFGENERYKELVHAQSIERDGRIGYRNIWFNKAEVFRIWAPQKPLDASDHSIWWAFVVPIFFLLILTSPMAISDTAKIFRYLRDHFYVQTIIPEGSLLIGKVDLQQGPQVADGKLLIQVRLQNNWDQAVRYEVTRTSFMFRGTAMSGEPASVAGTLFKNDDIYVRMARVPSNMLVGTAHDFKLSFKVFYGPAQGRLQWLVDREMSCTVPSKNFNIGACTYSRNRSERFR